MRVLVTGATGFIGRAVMLRLARDGHELTALVRSEANARERLGPAVRLVPLGPETDWHAALDGQEAVVNLAGEPVVGQRWTDRRKQALVESRVELTRQLVEALRGHAARPRVLVSASAVGFYGAHRAEPTDERTAAGSDFLAELCQAWEAEAVAAERLGVRVARLRIGLVVGREGGFLEPMLPLFRAGLGGPIGMGRAPVPWVHIDDVAEVVARALGDERFAGAFNLTAPEPVPNGELARAMGRALSRPAWLPVPTPALRLAFGKAAEAVLGGVQAVPARLAELGYSFRFASLDEALGDVLGSGGVTIDAAAQLPDEAYLRDRVPSHELRMADTLAAPLELVFPFFESPENLGLLTPPWMSFRIETPRPIAIAAGTTIDYGIRVGGMRRAWRTVIEHWEPSRRFVDAQHRGPYRSWWHEHRFEPAGPHTRMSDRVLFAVPFGPLGAVVRAAWVQGTVARIFAYRRSAMRLRFGLVEPA